MSRFIKNRKLVSALSVLVMMFFVSCATGPKYLNIKNEEFKKQVKRIVVIPVYIKDDIFPHFPDKKKEFPYNIHEKYKEIINKYIHARGRVFDKAVLNILTNSEYNFDVQFADKLTIEPKDISTITTGIKKMEYEFTQVKNVDYIPYNINYDLKKNKIEAILKKYSADAVYFHYINMCLAWDKYDLYKSYYIYPARFISYGGVLYSKDGKRIIDNRGTKSYKPQSLYEYYSEGIGDQLVRIDEFIIDDQDKTYTKLVMPTSLKGRYTPMAVPIDQAFTVNKITETLKSRYFIFSGF